MSKNQIKLIFVLLVFINIPNIYAQTIIEKNSSNPTHNFIITRLSKFFLIKNEAKIGINNNNPSYLVKPANAAKIKDM